MINYKELLEKFISELSHHEGVDVYFDVEDVISQIRDEISSEEFDELIMIYKRKKSSHYQTPQPGLTNP